jgi:cold shock CspA family protein
MSNNGHLTGKVVFFAPEKRFGFIKPDGTESGDVFFHLEQFDGDEPALDGRVAFQVEADPRREGPGGARRPSSLSNNNSRAASAEARLARAQSAFRSGPVRFYLSPGRALPFTDVAGGRQSTSLSVLLRDPSPRHAFTRDSRLRLAGPDNRSAKWRTRQPTAGEPLSEPPCRRRARRQMQHQ